MKKTLAFLALFLIALIQPVLAQQAAAPFGLKWMVTASEIEKLGVVLRPAEGTTFGKTYVATSLPKALADMRYVMLSFGHDDRLWRIVVLGEEFANDQYGSRILERYNQLAVSLAKNYTETGVYERRPSDTFYGRAENFAYSLSQNEVNWFRTYKSDATTVELSANSNHKNTFWRLIYAQQEGEKAFEASKAGAELDAL